MSTSHKRLRDLPLEERLRVLGLDQPITPEALKRRREWVDRVEATAKRIGKIDIPINDLLHLSDEELDAKYGRKKPTATGSPSENHD